MRGGSQRRWPVLVDKTPQHRYAPIPILSVTCIVGTCLPKQNPLDHDIYMFVYIHVALRRQDKARQGKTRQVKARRGKTRQSHPNARTTSPLALVPCTSTVFRSSSCCTLTFSCPPSPGEQYHEQSDSSNRAYADAHQKRRRDEISFADALCWPSSSPRVRGNDRSVVGVLWQRSQLA